MPEINGANLSPLRNEYLEDLTLLQQQAKNSRFRRRLLKVVQVGCGMLCSASLYSAFRVSSLSDRVPIPLNEASGYISSFMLNTCYSNRSCNENSYIEESTQWFLLAGFAFILAILYEHAIRKYNAIEDKSVIEYADITPYEGALELDNKHDACPISYIPVADIEQKVFYRTKVFEYQYLMLDFMRPNVSRDHTGQPYNKNEFYRLDDSNIKYAPSSET